MDNFILPKNIMGTVKISPKDWADQYYISEAKFAIEKIEGIKLVNIWATTHHYETHHGKEVLVPDVSFEIMQPISGDFENGQRIQLDFPSSIGIVEHNWEDFYFSSFYQFQYLKITNWSLKLTPINENYKIEATGFITDDINDQSGKHFFESEFETKMEPKINSRWNWKYSLDNPEAVHRNY